MIAKFLKKIVTYPVKVKLAAPVIERLNRVLVILAWVRNLPMGNDLGNGNRGVGRAVLADDLGKQANGVGVFRAPVSSPIESKAPTAIRLVDSSGPAHKGQSTSLGCRYRSAAIITEMSRKPLSMLSGPDQVRTDDLLHAMRLTDSRPKPHFPGCLTNNAADLFSPKHPEHGGEHRRKKVSGLYWPPTLHYRPWAAFFGSRPIVMAVGALEQAVAA